uniref:EB domain-containing protein n=1 Tax=Timema tahoe TaxID=61484 RepID=A0A7R9P0A3_9NEOP|nr:unnamed protein product [Timema tahoe]
MDRDIDIIHSKLFSRLDMLDSMHIASEPRNECPGDGRVPSHLARRSSSGWFSNNTSALRQKTARRYKGVVRDHHVTATQSVLDGPCSLDSDCFLTNNSRCMGGLGDSCTNSRQCVVRGNVTDVTTCSNEVCECVQGYTPNDEKTDCNGSTQLLAIFNTVLLALFAVKLLSFQQLGGVPTNPPPEIIGWLRPWS